MVVCKLLIVVVVCWLLVLFNFVDGLLLPYWFLLLLGSGYWLFARCLLCLDVIQGLDILNLFRAEMKARHFSELGG